MLDIMHGLGKLAKQVALANQSPIKSTAGTEQQEAHATPIFEKRQTRSNTLASRLASLCRAMLETSIHSPPETSESTLDRSMKKLSLKTETEAESTKPPAQAVNVVAPSTPEMQHTPSKEEKRKLNQAKNALLRARLNSMPDGKIVTEHGSVDDFLFRVLEYVNIS